MKKLLFILCISLQSVNISALDRPIALQFKYSPLGTINADEDEFDYTGRSYEKYDMDFARSMGVKFMVDPLYLSLQESVTDIDNDIPDVKVQTLSLGFAGIANEPELSMMYLLGSLGVGYGRFRFKDPSLDDWELFIEGTAEVGIHFEDTVFVGLGIDWQHFGEPGESKANLWNLYVGTFIKF